MKAKYEVADVFRMYGEEYKKTHAMSEEQRKVMAAIMVCRTAQLGGHQEVCNNCGTIRNSYNSCRNRHCPKCQTMTKEEWLDKRRTELLPCGYFHIVFTIPHVLNQLIRDNQRILLGCLFAAVKQTLFIFADDPQWKLEGKPGILAILHTWSQVLIQHFHIHCLVPAGVLSHDKTKWIKSNDKFLFRVESLAKEFKKQYLTRIKKEWDKLTLPPNSDELMKEAWSKTWIVFAKKPFSGPEQVLTYLGRYTHRIAISNHRIKAVDNNEVTFTYKARSDENKTKTMTLNAMEFIRRFLLHVLPSRFMKIRYYGFLANTNKKKSIPLIRRLIGKDMDIQVFINETTQEKVLRLTGHDILQCPNCKKGRMVSLGIPPALNSS